MNACLKNKLEPQTLPKYAMLPIEQVEILSKYSAKPYLNGYLKDKLKNLYIEIKNTKKAKAFDLYDEGKLEGWCWETTQSVAPFLCDNAKIERGNLYFNSPQSDPYFHSWISLNFDGLDFVFDPSLGYVNSKELYYRVFKVHKKGEVSADVVKNTLIEHLKKNEQQINIIGDKASLENAILVPTKEDENAPFFRGKIEFRQPKIENGEIKELTAHIYSPYCR